MLMLQRGHDGYFAHDINFFPWLQLFTGDAFNSVPLSSFAMLALADCCVGTRFQLFKAGGPRTIVS